MYVAGHREDGGLRIAFLSLDEWTRRCVSRVKWWILSCVLADTNSEFIERIGTPLQN